ncbi:MAG: transglutaminase family protein [Chloroflexi bacterium]|nr:transglutaminase family protein [Chloroflexota bacterium]
MRLRYRYTYTAPVSAIRQQLVVVPADRHGDQRLLSYGLRVHGADSPASISWEHDRFGNRVCCVLVDHVEHALQFEVHYLVARRSSSGPAAQSRSALHPPFWRDYLEPTALTAPDDRLHAVAQEIAASTADPRARAERAHDWAAGAIAYQFGVTGVQTPAALALHLGRGVCQDYAHLMLCVLRQLGVPARYVSGHLLGEGAPHAWVEALLQCPGDPSVVEVVAFDPTHHRRTRLDYLTVAVGRDFADVTPTSGYFTGSARGNLTYSKQAKVVDVSYFNHLVSRDDDRSSGAVA